MTLARSAPRPGDAPRMAVPVHGLLLAAAVLVPLALAGAFAWTSWRTAWQEAEGEMRRDAVAIAEYSGRLLDGYRQVAERIAALVQGVPEAALPERRAEIEQRLHEILLTLPDLEWLEVSARDGRPLLAVPARDEAAAGLVPAGGDGGEPVLHPLAPVAGLPAAFRFALTTGGGDAVRVSLAVRTGKLAQRLARMVTGPEDAAALLTREAGLLARAAPPGPPAGRPAPGSPLGSALAAGLERWSGRGPSPHDGVDRMSAFSRVEGFPAYAIVARPASRIMADWRAGLALPVTLGLASALLLALLALQVRRNQRAMAGTNRLLEARVAERTEQAAQAVASQRTESERLRLAVEAAGFASWEIDLRDDRISRHGSPMMNIPALPLSGFSLDAYLEWVNPEDRSRVRQAIGDLAFGRQARHRAEYRVRRADGGRIWVESYGGVIERDPATGAPLRLAGVSRDITERRQAEAQLRGSEARLRAALAAARFSTWQYDVQTDEGARHGPLTDAFPDPPASGLRLADWLAPLHPEDRPAAERAFRDLIAERSDRMLVAFRLRKPDGSWSWIESAGTVAERDPGTGAVLRVAGVARDITEDRLAVERQALLAREVDHRAKNALAVVQAALRLTPKADAASYARAVEGRVRALARAHTLLADAQWQGASLQALAAAELAAFLPFEGAAPATARARLEGPELTLAPGAAQGLSMVLHELATNATKYGALSADGGSVALSWHAEEAAGLLRLRWEERGGPPVTAAPERRGFGSRVVEATVRDQLGGTLARDWDAAGLVCRIDLPLARALGGTAAPGRLRAAE